jgi:hypothetical protein
MWADRRADPALLPDMDARRAGEAQAAFERSRLEALLAADDDRLDVSD